MKSFDIWIEGPIWPLTVEEIWPDGDAPENPSAEDVIEAMKSYGSSSMVIRDWNFDDGLVIHVDSLTYGP